MSPLPITLPDGYAFDMMPVPGGAYLRGDTHGDIDKKALPAHPVEVDGFYLGKYPVTQGLWRAVARSAEGQRAKIDPDPFHFKGSDALPAENISWDDITTLFLPALNRLTGRTFRLPTEAEWEYAAKGGPHHRDGYRYAGSDNLDEVGWHDGNSDNRTHEVGEKYPNQLGLYDMSGNVWEWCADAWDEKEYARCAEMAQRTEKPIYNPSVESGPRRLVRGGSAWSAPLNCAPAYRHHRDAANRDNGIGVRLVLQFGEENP